MGRKPSQQLREARAELAQAIARKDSAEIYYQAKLKTAYEEVDSLKSKLAGAMGDRDEHQRRRLAVERELDDMAGLMLRTEPPPAGFFGRIGNWIDRIFKWL